jgi:hypothetical protein
VLGHAGQKMLEEMLIPIFRGQCIRTAAGPFQAASSQGPGIGRQTIVFSATDQPKLQLLLCSSASLRTRASKSPRLDECQQCAPKTHRLLSPPPVLDGHSRSSSTGAGGGARRAREDVTSAPSDPARRATSQSGGRRVAQGLRRVA